MTSPFPAGSQLVAYLRDSGGSTQDLSLAQQAGELRQWCTNNGHTLSKIFIDEATPGSSTVGRNGFHAMLAHLRNTDNTDIGLILWRFNRFARDFDDAQFYKADLRRRGITIHALKDNIPDSPMGRFFESAVDWMNQQYLLDMGEDIKRGLRHLVITYGCIPGRPPPGFKRERVVVGQRRNGKEHVGHRWVVDPETVPLVRKAFEMRQAGATLKEILLETRLYTSLRSFGYMFRNELYRGKLVWGPADNPVIIEDYAEPIIDEELWASIQVINAATDLKRKKTNHPRRKASRYILSGLAYCGVCGTAFRGVSSKPKNAKGWSYYNCRGDLSDGVCNVQRIPKEVLEDAVLNALSEHILAPENIERLLTIAERQPESKSAAPHLAGNISSVEKDIARIVKAIKAAGHSPALIGELQDLESHKRELTALQTAAATQSEPRPLTNDKVIEKGKALAAAIREAPPSEQRQILRGLIKRITVQREEKTVWGTIDYYSPEKIISMGNGHVRDL